MELYNKIKEYSDNVHVFHSMYIQKT
ncbi:hypothetical protein ACUC2M_13945 [Bacillus cytotoxicus]